MEQRPRSPSIYLVASAPDAPNPRPAHEAVAKLEECRTLLAACGQAETVSLIDIALLQLRMQIRGVSEADLNALCAALTDQGAAQSQHSEADSR